MTFISDSLTCLDSVDAAILDDSFLDRPTSDVLLDRVIKDAIDRYSSNGSVNIETSMDF